MANKGSVMGELILLGLLVVIGVSFWFMTFSFAVSPLDRSGGAGLFPRLVIIFLLAFVVVRIIQVLLKKEKEHFVFFELFTGIRLFFLLSFVLYVVILNWVGYLISSILFLAVTTNYFSYKTNDTVGTRKAVVIRNGALVVFVFLMYYFFDRILHIALPRGFIGM